MGNTSSTDTQNKINNGNKTKPNDTIEQNDLETEQKTQQIEEQIEQEITKQTAQFQELLDKAKVSIEGDDSIPNLVHNYSELRTFQEPQFECIETFVGQMKDAWEGIMSKLPSIEHYCGKKGKEKSRTIKKIHVDYWRLLLKTRSKIGKLLTQCKIQKRNVSTLLDILKEGNKTELCNDDKMAHDDCIRRLGKWIETDLIQDLIEDWKRMSAVLEKEKNEWTALATEAAKYWANVTRKISRIAAITIAVIGAIAIIAIIIVATAGTGTAAIGTGAVAAAAATEVSIVSTTAAVTIGVAVGAAVVVGAVGTCVAVKEIHDYKRNAVKVRNNINKLAADLEKMFKTGQKMKNKLTKFKDASEDIETYLDYMKDDESLRVIKGALKDMTEYLDKYMEQGQKVMKTISAAAEDVTL